MTNAKEIIREWGYTGTDGGETLFVERLRAFLTEKQIAQVLQVIDATCTECWDGDAGCQCWNDE